MTKPIATAGSRLRTLVCPQRQLPGGWWLDGALLAAFVGLTAALAARTVLLGADLAVLGWCDGHRPRAAELIAHGFNYVGQGTPLTLLTLALAGWRARGLRSVRPVLIPMTAYLLTYLSIGPLKLLSARPAPHLGQKHPEVDHPEWLFSMPGSMSYPSGHVINSLVWYTALSLVLSGLLSRRWQRTLRIAPVIVVTTTTIYLGYHWLTDDVAGVLLGVILARILLRIQWDLIPLPGRLTAAGWGREVGLGTGGPDR